MLMNVSQISGVSWQELILLASQIPTKIPSLEMLIIFGSRARGNTHVNSDWDFAILYNQQQQMENRYLSLEVYDILSDVLRISDDIDVINLSSCSLLIAHAVARDGKVLYEKKSGLFESFQSKSLLSENQLEVIQKDLRKGLEVFLTKRGV
jgi:predicted nucleotidyltransferase